MKKQKTLYWDIFTKDGQKLIRFDNFKDAQHYADYHLAHNYNLSHQEICRCVPCCGDITLQQLKQMKKSDFN